MGWLQMSKQELRRVEVLTEVLAGSRTTESAADVVDMSLRQAQQPVNVPGTSDENSNWRRKLSLSLDQLEASGRLAKLADDINKPARA